MVKKYKFTHKDVTKEWQQAVQDRAKEQDVSEDDVVRFGIHHDFKKERVEAERLSVLREIRDELKKAGKK